MMVFQPSRCIAVNISKRSSNTDTSNKGKVLSDGKEHFRKMEMCNSILQGMPCKCVFVHHKDELLSPTFKER